jgi:DNA repair photolyase
MFCEQQIIRKSLLYKTGVEYGDYTINHVEGCSHGCRYPCYAYLMARRFGKVDSYQEWCKPKIVGNAIELLEKEIPKYIDDIKSVHLCFSTDPFMYGYEDINFLSLKILETLNENRIKCTALTKGILPYELSNLSKENEYGITLVSLNENFRREYEPFSASYTDRINSLRALHQLGMKTWVSLEPYPTPNIINQDFTKILESINFVDKIIFGRLNYNSLASNYKDVRNYYNILSDKVIDFCLKRNINYHIKKGTVTETPKAEDKISKNLIAVIQ